MTVASKSLAIEAIKKKLVGGRLSYQEIFSVMDEIANRKLGPILTTYFAAAGFKEGFSLNELFYLTKAMAETGQKLHFKGVVADKHSTGGIAGTRTTMILVPIIASANILIPKTSSRAITTPSGTADTMEVLAPVTFTPLEIEKMVKKINGCIVWGGHLGLAPADDVIVQVEEPLAFESFDKIIISVMAKKVASGANHVIFDIPVGPTVKIKRFSDAEIMAKKFQFLGRKFGMKVIIDINQILEPAGRGVGPILEAQDVLRVLEQRKNRPLALEKKALRLAGKLLNLCGIGSGEALAQEILSSGKALEKMREIIKIQGGNSHIVSDDLKLAKYKKEILSQKKGRVVNIDNHQLNVICRILGAPADQAAGLFFEKRLEEKVDKNEILFIIYSDDKWRLKEAEETLKNLPILKVE